MGIATGPSGLYVIDLDVGGDEPPPRRWDGAAHGRDVLAGLAHDAAQPVPDNTFTVRTPSGGLHLYFWLPDGSGLRNTIALAGWRIDSRGPGGYVVAPGTVMSNGRYTVLTRTPVISLPGWMIPLFTPPLPQHSPTARGPRLASALSGKRRRAYLRAVAARVSHAPPRTAHNTLLYAAITLGSLVAGGDLDDWEARRCLSTAAERRRIPPREATTTIADGMKYGSRRPRHLG